MSYSSYRAATARERILPRADRRFWLCVAALILGACARQPDKPVNQRIAILRFENLGADPANDWMGRAFSEIVTEAVGAAAIPGGRLQLAGHALGARPNGTPGISSQRDAAIASGAKRLGYGEYLVQGGIVEARLTIEDPATGSTVQTLSVRAPNVIEAATALARPLSGGAPPYATSNVRAIEGYASALESNDAAAAVRHLEQAIVADPNFTIPYRMLAEIKSRQQDRAGAIRLLETAVSHAGSPSERARIEAEMATMRGDLAGRDRALAALTKANPRDHAAWRALAEAAMARRNYRQAADAFSKALEIEPEDADAWNMYGYATAYTGDLAGGMNAGRRYQSLRPNEANPLDSQGDIQLMHGRLGEAEALYLEAAKKDPQFLNGADLFKAAVARLMTGDISGADALAKQFSDARAAVKDPLLPFRNAEWAWAAGRRQEACRQMESAAAAAEASSQRELASRGYIYLTVWKLMLGEREAASRMADKAIALAGQAMTQPAAIARFLTQPPAPAREWAGRAERMFPNASSSSVKDLTLACALLFAGEFQGALPLLKQFVASPVSTMETSPELLLAWALAETGAAKDAEPLLRRNPLPQAAGMGPFWALNFPRLYYLRGLAAEKSGRTEEARNHYRLFLQLSGPDPLIWGEEKRAKAAL